MQSDPGREIIINYFYEIFTKYIQILTLLILIPSIATFLFNIA